MKKYLNVLICFVLAPVALCAQNSEKAKKLLDEVYQKSLSYKNIYIGFRYTLDNAKENIKQETRGTLLLQGEKYKLDYMGVTKMFDGKKVYTIIPENEEVTIETDKKDDPNTVSPSQMFHLYKKGYNYKWDIQQNVKGRKIQYIELKPIKSNTEIKQILLGIDVMTKHVYNLIEVGKNDTRTTIVVSEFKTNQPLPANTFEFDQQKYKEQGYYISHF